MLRVYTETQIDAGSLDEDKNPDDLSDDDKHFDIKKEESKPCFQVCYLFSIFVALKSWKCSSDLLTEAIAGEMSESVWLVQLWTTFYGH